MEPERTVASGDGKHRTLRRGCPYIDKLFILVYNSIVIIAKPFS